MEDFKKYITEKKQQAERLRDNTSQKDYFKGQVEILEEILLYLQND
jgi:hypothetical protein